MKRAGYVAERSDLVEVRRRPRSSWRSANALALFAFQPALIGEPPSWRATPELITARRLLRDVARFEDAVADHRRAVVEMLHDAPDDDDLPF